jgi:hypothetical protein
MFTEQIFEDTLSKWIVKHNQSFLEIGSAELKEFIGQLSLAGEGIRRNQRRRIKNVGALE